jgi:cytochrome c biogenesis protein CcmG/thiol:disulfide interchange protein DsbE
MLDQIAGFAFRNATWLFGGLLAAAIIGVVLVVRGRSRRILRWAAAVVLTGIALLSGGALYAATTIHHTITDRVARLSFVDVRDGATHTIRDYRGKVVLLNFWATWCPPCRDEMPDLNRLSDEQRDAAIITVTDEDADTVRRYEEKIIALRTIVGTFRDQHPAGGLRAAAYSGRPTTVIIDREGSVREILIAGQSYATFAKAIARAQ